MSGAPATPADAALTEGQRRQRHLAALGELMPALVHDLNNPLTGISAFAELLEAEVTDPEHRKSLGMIRAEAMKAVRLLKDVQAFARGSANPSASVDLNAILESTLRLRGYLHRGGGLQVHLALEPELPRVRGDAQQLQQAIMHVVANAETALADLEPGVREMRIITARDGMSVVCTIDDSGPGMSPDVLARIFEPRFTTRAAVGAAGLGLAIARQVITAHGGTIAVDSTPGRGTRVTMRLPAAPAAAPSPRESAA
ncbi:MAG: hypothetical protein HYX65_01880 [Gemmatimonadetes bacterium]|nr:hypothetical protein [Gemmatimonadota bacterium]